MIIALAPLAEMLNVAEEAKRAGAPGTERGTGTWSRSVREAGFSWCGGIGLRSSSPSGPSRPRAPAHNSRSLSRRRAGAAEGLGFPARMGEACGHAASAAPLLLW